MALGRDHKLTATGEVVRGAVGHDRIQQAGATESIGEAIRRWYGLPKGYDFEKIDVEVSLHRDGHFILAPTRAKLRSRTREIELEKTAAPLTFTSRNLSIFWRRQVEHCLRQDRDSVKWVRDEIYRVVSDHHNPDVKNLLESDVLRAAGALSKLGVQLGPYVGKSYDCDPSRFQFLKLLPYECPVEIKKQSRDFRYQMLRYKPLPRAVVLCVDDNLVNPPDHIDVLELAELCRYLNSQLPAV
ncbi:MAG: hypothetical protein FJ395_13585 [Verrucomicrobia bacterium]|nr:hypothetical protein [Verrucomicrobiota bacterium]